MKLNKKWLCNISLFLGIMILCIIHAVTSVHNADFGPLNGTFQDFNPIRRFLAGQIPYKDFSDYLGLGHLYLGTVSTIFFGRTFFASRIAFVFLALFSFAMISLTLGTTILNSVPKSLAITGIILSLLLTRTELLKNNFAFNEEIQYAFQYTLKNGNSARMVRAFVLPLVSHVLIFVYALKLRKGYSAAGKDLILYSFLSGFILPWSNDYGISLFLCLAIISVIIFFSRTRSIIKTAVFSVLHILLSVAGIIVCVEILTLGNFQAWLGSVFGTEDFQRWYPNTTKHFYIFSIDMSWTSMLQVTVCLFYIYRLFSKHGSGKEIIRAGIPCLANMTGFCAMNEYYMISGDSAREVPLIILTMTVAFEGIGFIFSLVEEHEKKIQKALLFISIAVMISWALPALYNEFLFQKMTRKTGTYISQMGGNVNELGESLISTSKKLGDSRFFSTYASAMELVTGQFQPTGTDYIIHVLGDEKRAEYLDAFATDDFQYAVTIKEDFSPWEYYIQRSNWFFYRELYRNWHPAFLNRYQLYWERNAGETQYIVSSKDINIEVHAEQNESTRAKIVINTDDNVNGFADLKINYSVNKNNGFLSKLAFQRMLYISRDKNSFSELPFYGTNYLRANNEEYIPVTIVNGYGEILLSSVPEENTNLVINDVSCEDIFTVPLAFIEVSGIGYYEETPCFRVPKILRYKTAVSGVKQLTLGTYEVPVKKVKENEDYILLLLDLQDLSFKDLEKYIGKGVVASVRR